MHAQKLLQTYIRLLVTEATVTKKKEKGSPSLNAAIGNITETTAALIALGVDPPSSLKDFQTAVLGSLTVNNQARALENIRNSWKSLKEAGTLEAVISSGVQMGQHLAKYLENVDIESIVWTGPGGGKSADVGTADIVVRGTINGKDFVQGFSGKASEQAAKTLANLSLKKLFPELEEKSKFTTVINDFAKSKAAELASSDAAQPSSWPTGVTSGYEGVWKIAHPGEKYNSAKHREEGKEIWNSRITNSLSVAIAKKIAEEIKPYLLNAAQVIKDHLSEGSGKSGDVMKLLPTGIFSNNPIEDKLNKMLNPSPESLPLSLAAGAVGTYIIISMSGEDKNVPLVVLRPRVKDPGRSVSVNTTVQPAAKDK